MEASLVDALRERHITFDASDSGEWVRFPCPHGGFRYVVRSRLADGYLAWCAAGDPSKPDWYLAPDRAIESSGPSELSANSNDHSSRSLSPDR